MRPLPRLIALFGELVRMLPIRHLIFIMGFFAINFSLVVYSFNANLYNNQFKDSSVSSRNLGSESYFKKVNFYRLKKGSKSLHLNSAELINNQNTGDIIMSEPNGVIVDEDGKTIYYSGKTGFYKKKDNQLSLNSDVYIRHENTEAVSGHFNYFIDEEVMHLSKDVETESRNDKSLYDIFINSETLKYNANKGILNYFGDVSGKVTRKRKFEQPISFKSNKLDFFEEDNKAILTTDVQVVKGSTTANSRSGELFLENYNKKLKYFALSDDVVVNQKVNPIGKKPFERRAFSEKLEGYAKEEIVVLLGYPKVYQNEDVIKGNIVILRDDNETIEVDNANTNFRLK